MLIIKRSSKLCSSNHLCRETTGNRWVPAQRANNSECASMLWRHDVLLPPTPPLHPTSYPSPPLPTVIGGSLHKGLSDYAELWCFLCNLPEHTVEQTVELQVILVLCDVIIMEMLPPNRGAVAPPENNPGELPRLLSTYVDVIKWKHFPRYWPFLRIHWCELPSQRPVTHSFDVFVDLRLNKRYSKQSRRQRFETPSCPLWRHCNVSSIIYSLTSRRLYKTNPGKIVQRNGRIELHLLVPRL